MRHLPETLNRRQILWGLLSGVLASCSSASPDRPPGEIVFGDVEDETRTFIKWERAIKLSRGQESVKKAALSAIPAPCCSDNSAYTCCCPCNMARSIWGLANYMISRRQADAATVRAKVEEWIAYINPAGFADDECYTGACARPFHQDGCGGMSLDRLAF